MKYQFDTSFIHYILWSTFTMLMSLWRHSRQQVIILIPDFIDSTNSPCFLYKLPKINSPLIAIMLFLKTEPRRVLSLTKVVLVLCLRWIPGVWWYGLAQGFLFKRHFWKKMLSRCRNCKGKNTFCYTTMLTLT